MMLKRALTSFLLILLCMVSIQAQDTTSFTIGRVVWSPSGEYIAVELNNPYEATSIIRIYDSQTLELIQTMENPTGVIRTLSWSPDSQRIVTNDSDDNSTIRNPLNGEILALFGTGDGATQPIPSMAGSEWNFDGSLLANHYTFGSGVDIRDGYTGQGLPFVHHLGTTFGMFDFAWSDHDNRIAIATFSETVFIVDSQTAEILSEITVEDISYILDWRGDYLYTLRKYSDNFLEYTYTYQVWNIETGERISSFTVGRYDSVWSSWVSGDGQWFVLKRPGNILQIRDAFSGISIQSQQLPIGEHAALSPDGQQLAIVQADGGLRIQELPLTGERIPPLPTDYILFINLGMGSTLLARVSEAPIDMAVDYIGFMGTSVEGLAYNNQPAHFHLSPDVQRFVYAKINESGYYDIFEHWFNYGGELQPIITGGWNLYPVYSFAEFTDDAEIAYLHSENGSQFELAVLDTSRQSIQTVTLPNSIYIEQPSWFPSAEVRQISFAMLTEADDFDIFVADLDNRSIEPMFEHPANDYSPRWSPDGTQLAFVSDRNPIEGIFLFDIASEEIQFLSEGNSPEWSPDGTKIAFMRDDAIYVMDASGENIQLFIENAVTPRWLKSYS
jgi:WD40 repeat protein